MVLRRLNGETINAAPVLTLITQFGGKTHTLTALYHAVKNVPSLDRSIQADLLRELQLDRLPSAPVAVFVGNAWDPTDTHENPLIDVARQLAGDDGVAALGSAARTTPAPKRLER